MQSLTYESVQRDPELLEDIMRAARRQRAQVVHALFVAAIDAIGRRLRRRTAQDARRAVQLTETS